MRKLGIIQISTIFTVYICNKMLTSPTKSVNFTNFLIFIVRCNSIQINYLL